MAGGIVYGLIHGLPLPDLARFATASGAYAVTQLGPGIDDKDAHRNLIGLVEIQ
jgi:sugar/nucleoside kinase (ribokinase family)